jgi:hypothetical protein
MAVPTRECQNSTWPDTDTLNLVAFIHSQQDKAMSQTGTRKGVDESDLQTGNAEAGKRYFGILLFHAVAALAAPRIHVLLLDGESGGPSTTGRP